MTATATLQAMVEAMAAEIERQERAHDAGEAPGAMMTDDLDLEKIARAGLEAIKEPTDAMVEAANDLWGFGDDGTGEQARPEDEWSAMIDAILKEQP